MSLDREAKMVRVVIAAGGTGGHIYPGIALAQALQALDERVVVSFVGTPRGLESRLIPEAGYELDLIDMVPFAGRDRWRVPSALPRSVFQSRRILTTRRATVVAGMGGYSSLPLMIAARMRKIPSVIHESGATLGRANMLSSLFTKNIALAFPHVRVRVPSGGVPRVIGMPLRREVATMDIPALREQARMAYGLGERETMLLMFGGSQGAASINRLAVELSRRWRSRDDIAILLKTGPKQVEEVRAEVETMNRPKTMVTGFIERMDQAYAAADIVICRAGAGTVAEVAIAGLPSILIPYPHAPGDHQRLNASELVGAGAAEVVNDEEATAERVGPIVERLVSDPSVGKAMRAAALHVARPRAAEELAQWVLDISG